MSFIRVAKTTISWRVWTNIRAENIELRKTIRLQLAAQDSKAKEGSALPVGGTIHP